MKRNKLKEIKPSLPQSVGQHRPYGSLQNHIEAPVLHWVVILKIKNQKNGKNGTKIQVGGKSIIENKELIAGQKTLNHQAE